MNFEANIRPEVKGFKAYTPGQSIESIKEKFGLAKVIKMASNENPLGVSPVVQRTISDNANLSFRYPAGGNPSLCKALANYHNIDANRVVVGNGSDEIIDLILRITATAKENNIVAFKPCFGIYTTQAALSGIEIRQAKLNEDFSFDFDSLLSLVNEKTVAVFVTNPDNPSGYAVKKEEIIRLANSLPKNCLLVIDEAYIDFCDKEDDYSVIKLYDKLDNIAILRTFSKSRGLAGIRLGYAVLPEILADYYNRVRLPFSVNILAEKAGLSALEDEVFYNETLRVVKEGREFLNTELAKLGCKVYPSMANFIMFEPSNMPENDSKYIYDALLAKGIIIRPLHSYGLSNKLRVSIGSEQENIEFINKLSSVM